jgi:hypothetical protein
MRASVWSPNVMGLAWLGEGTDYLQTSPKHCKKEADGPFTGKGRVIINIITNASTRKFNFIGYCNFVDGHWVLSCKAVVARGRKAAKGNEGQHLEHLAHGADDQHVEQDDTCGPEVHALGARTGKAKLTQMPSSKHQAGRERPLQSCAQLLWKGWTWLRVMCFTGPGWSITCRRDQ